MGWGGSASLSLFLSEAVSDEQAEAVRRQVDRRDDVAETRLIDRDQALAEFRRLSGFGEAIDLDPQGREALLLGGLTHTLETDDLHRASVVHPGCVVVPAAIAAGPMGWVATVCTGLCSLKTGNVFLSMVVGILIISYGNKLAANAAVEEETSQHIKTIQLQV